MEALSAPGNSRSTVTSPSCVRGLTQSGDMPRVTWVAEGGVKATTCGVRAPANGAVGVGPGGAKITLGKFRAGQALGDEQLKLC
jgi:hypothetical protein